MTDNLNKIINYLQQYIRSNEDKVSKDSYDKLYEALDLLTQVYKHDSII